MNTADFMVERQASIRKEAVSTAQVPWREPMTTPAGAGSGALQQDADSGALLRDVLARIGDKWSVIVICRLDGRSRRFNELRRLTEGITQRMLSATLRHLERDGLVQRTVYPTVPPQVEYALTERGRSLHTILYQLVDWTGDHLPGIQASRAVYDTSHGTHPARPASM
jgi:DNA-binding HxlR family transcriptional regulator